jgi:putative nucleotidyltransferase with HDIG domain
MRSQDIPWADRVRVLTIWALGVILATVILAAPLSLGSQVRLQEGDVARADVVAPRQITYVSEILTQQRRESAANTVPDVYDPPQARVGRQQLTVANQILDFIVTIRSDPQIDTPTKIAHLNAISQLDLPPAVAGRILALSSSGWERTAAEVQLVLERAMREEIRETNLADEKRKVAARVRLDMPEEEATVVSEIVQDLLVPNSFYNADRTEERQRSAREGVEPMTATVERNETILREGDIVTSMDIEALDALGLRQMGWSLANFRAAAALVLLLGLVYLYYFWRQEPRLWLDVSVSLIVAVSVLAFVTIAKVVIPTHALLPFLIPYAALTMLLSVTIRFRLALVLTGLFTILIGWLSAGDVQLMAYALLPGLVGALKLRRGERLSSYAWAAFYVAVTCVLVVLAFSVGSGDWDVRGLAELVGAGLFNGLISMTVTLFGAYLVGAVFGVTTSLQLMELSRPTHPLLRHLLLKAPGTYHHTLIVANMAERAAETIGADALLARVGSYYHDVGKTVRPYFFIENRSDPIDPHASLDPYTSAQVIIAHVKDGLDLARKYHLPQRVTAFIPEHHGTQLASYFYHQAVKQAGSTDSVDRTQFQYPGPRPQSRETAITMLADGAEATVRSKRPATVEELEKVVADSIQSRLSSGQLDNCSMSVEDLRAVQRAFVDVLRGLQHPRVDYPPEFQPGQLAATPSEPLTPATPSAMPLEELAEPAVSSPGSGGTSVF